MKRYCCQNQSKAVNPVRALICSTLTPIVKSNVRAEALLLTCQHKNDISSEPELPNTSLLTYSEDTKPHWHTERFILSCLHSSTCQLTLVCILDLETRIERGHVQNHHHRTHFESTHHTHHDGTCPLCTHNQLLASKPVSRTTSGHYHLCARQCHMQLINHRSIHWHVQLQF